MMKNLLLLVMIAVTSATGIAQPLELKEDANYQPTHLTPVQPGYDAYRKRLEKKLLLTNANYGSMLFLPAFEGEFSVSVYGIESKKEKTQKYYITYTKAERNLYYSMPGNSSILNWLRPVSVKRIDVEIDREFAVAIQRAWATYLLKTRYPKKTTTTLDGYTVKFSVFVGGMGTLQGEADNPQHGLPLEFVELGCDLKDYCTNAKVGARDKRAKLIRKLNAFAARARNS